MSMSFFVGINFTISKLILIGFCPTFNTFILIIIVIGKGVSGKEFFSSETSVFIYFSAVISNRVEIKFAYFFQFEFFEKLINFN
jgi:hypothetical protein